MDSLFEKKVYICQNKDSEIRFDSTSGGFFSAIANYVIDRQGFVFGAEFDENWNVVHGYGTEKKDLIRFRGSKYVQSDLKDTFQNVKNLLNDDRWVLFTGTPCQVAGLSSFLGKDYEKLVLMDIVCYSISSPIIWKAFLQHLIKYNKLDLTKVTRIKFRDKTQYGYEYTLMTFYDKDQKELYSSGPESNQMLRSFVSNTSTRPSCYNCAFKNIERVSDFTAWDCYNVYKYKKSLDDNQGTSHVMIHSQKGERIIKELAETLTLYEVDLNEAVESEPAMVECAKPSKLRHDFFSSIASGQDVFDIYFKENIKIKIERFLRKILSKTGLYSLVKRMIKG